MTPADLERSVRGELRSLSKANADEVARHLVMIGRLLPDDPDQAYAHAMAAQRRAGRVAVVREIVGVAAYHAGRWAEALSELRAARRMSGSSHVLPLMADAERGLGRPERALDLAASPEAQTLADAEKVEMAIVVSGARRDLGQRDAAVVALQIPQLTAAGPTQPYTVRLWYAYAEALLDVGRRDEALHWFARAAAADHDGLTDADERLAELEGVHIVDLEELSDAPDDGSDGSDSSDGSDGLSNDGLSNDDENRDNRSDSEDSRNEREGVDTLSSADVQPGTETQTTQTQPGHSKPEVSKPEVSKPEVSKPEVRQPEVRQPEVSKPEVSKPEVRQPEVTRPERRQPRGRPPADSPPARTGTLARPQPRVPGVAFSDTTEAGMTGTGDTSDADA